MVIPSQPGFGFSDKPTDRWNTARTAKAWGAAPELMLSTSAVFVSIFQLTLAGGALLGGFVVDSYGLSTTTMALGGAAAVAAAIVIRCFGRITSHK